MWPLARHKFAFHFHILLVDVQTLIPVGKLIHGLLLLQRDMIWILLWILQPPLIALILPTLIIIEFIDRLLSIFL